jgi:hypothetical protein
MKKSIGIGSKSRDIKRFIYFSLYAWGYPSLMTSENEFIMMLINNLNILFEFQALTFLLDQEESFVPEAYRANIGIAACWFSKFSCS